MSSQILTTLLIFVFSSFLYSQNNSLSFDGIDDNVEIASSTALIPSQFTIEAWIKLTPDATSHPIFNKYNSNTDEVSYSFQVLQDNKIRFGAYETTTIYNVNDTDSDVITPNSWQHVAATFNLTTQAITIYVGGSEVASSPVAASTTIGSIYNGTNPVHLSKIIFQNGTSSYFNGLIDEVRFWDTERTQSEISNNMNTELTGNESGLVLYYKFDDNNSTCDIKACNLVENNGARMGTGGSNNLPQFSNDVPAVTDVNCGASTTCASLPVELSEFKGYPSSKEIILEWKTVGELNNYGFEVQNSGDKINWEIADFVAGEGTSREVKHYQYHDKNPHSGINYYRLKQIDFDGVFEYSKVIAVEYNKSISNFIIYPNPSRDLVNIQIDNPSSQRMRINIANNLGRSIWRSELIEGVSNWRKGIRIEDSGLYFITVQIGNEVYCERVVILNEK